MRLAWVLMVLGVTLQLVAGRYWWAVGFCSALLMLTWRQASSARRFNQEARLRLIAQEFYEASDRRARDTLARVEEWT